MIRCCFHLTISLGRWSLNQMQFFARIWIQFTFSVVELKRCGNGGIFCTLFDIVWNFALSYRNPPTHSESILYFLKETLAIICTLKSHKLLHHCRCNNLCDFNVHRIRPLRPYLCHCQTYYIMWANIILIIICSSYLCELSIFYLLVDYLMYGTVIVFARTCLRSKKILCFPVFVRS